MNFGKFTDLYVFPSLTHILVLSAVEDIWITLTSFVFSLFSFTCKSLSEALLFGEHGENMLCTEIVSDIQYNLCK